MFDAHLLFSDAWQATPATPTTLEWQNNWLTDTGSLTQRLQTHCQKHVKVQVLQHQFVAPNTTTMQALKLDNEERVLHREVLLKDNDTPLVFACSLLPESALIGRFTALRELGAQPLGHWIFTEPVLRRTDMQFALLTATALPAEAVIHSESEAPVWGRKTLFSGAQKPFLVSEFFLPSLWPSE